MPSHTNPNRPSSQKPRHQASIKRKTRRAQKAQQQQRRPTTTGTAIVRPHTSQAIRKSAPISKKKARKLDKKAGYARQRAIEEEFLAREVEMGDAQGRGGGASGEGGRGASEQLSKEEGMDLDT